MQTGYSRRRAANYRTLRTHGVTVRKTIDLLIATWCIEHGVPLLHRDRDLDRFEAYLGCGRCAPPDPYFPTRRRERAFAAAAFCARVPPAGFHSAPAASWRR